MHGHRTTAKRHPNHFLSLDALSEERREAWRSRRRLAHLALSDVLRSEFLDEAVGYTVDEVIAPAIEECIREGKPWESRRYMFHEAFNSIYRAAFGTPIGIDDPK